MKRSFIIRSVAAAMMVVAPLPLAAQTYSKDWHLDALEMIEDGRSDTASVMVDHAEQRLSQITDPVERVEYQRHLGEIYYKLNKSERGFEHYTHAMESALKLENAWRSLASVISLLEQHEATDAPREYQQKLLALSIDKDLLKRMSEDRFASEVGRYMEQFKYASGAQLQEVIETLRRIKRSPLRKKALYKLAKLKFSAEAKRSDRLENMVPMDMDALERFLWFVVTSKYYENTPWALRHNQQKDGLKKAYDRLSEEERQQYRSLYRQTLRN